MHQSSGLQQKLDIKYKKQKWQVIKEHYLKSILSDNPANKYKRINSSAIAYPGGKTMGVGLMMEHLPEIKTLVSPFFGGGSFEFAVSRVFNIPVVGYDINPFLVAFWRCLIMYNELFVDMLDEPEYAATIEAHRATMHIIQDYYKGKTTIDNDITMGLLFAHNIMLSWGNIFPGWACHEKMSEEKWGMYKDQLRRWSKQSSGASKGWDVEVVKADFEMSIFSSGGEFLYCDPPYIQPEVDATSQMRVNKDVYYGHKHFNHKKLLEVLKEHKGKFMLSYNDCELARKWYDWCRIVPMQWSYALTRRAHIPEGRMGYELLIMNY